MANKLRGVQSTDKSSCAELVPPTHERRDTDEMALRIFNPRQSRAHSAGTTRGRPVPKLFTIDETADLFNASPRTVRRLIEAGALPVHRLGGRLIRVSDADILAFLAVNRRL
jgi:excisionase family DNA binding protein